MVSGNKNQGWLFKKSKKTLSTRAFPIWDWTFDDVWIALAKNHWKYNKIYDYQYQKGIPSRGMRVSALIHETSWKAIEVLQEFEPGTYDKFVRRVAGTSSLNHMYDQDCETIPKELPYMFKDWKEYRDYLLVHLVKEEYWKLFRDRWEGQTGEKWYMLHCKEVAINDIDGTINHNYAVMLSFNESKKKAIERNKQLVSDIIERRNPA